MFDPVNAPPQHPGAGHSLLSHCFVDYCSLALLAATCARRRLLRLQGETVPFFMASMLASYAGCFVKSSNHNSAAPSPGKVYGTQLKGS